MKKTYTLLILLLLALSVFSQNKAISGKVTDTKGIGMPGVTVQIVGTQTGTLTDINGNYRLDFTTGSLRFSFIGFLAQDIVVGSQSVINVVLEEQAQTLDQVVVIGYGTQKKKDLTTAVSVVGEKELKDRPLVSAAQAIQGKAAGVQVVQTSGKPGSALSVRVRGATSVLAGNEPLYVVDGVPTTDIQGISPNDVASMSVLKDASSSAIYGSRAANGVVLITTKRGMDKTPVVSFSTYFGASKLRKTIEVLDTKEYRKLMNEIISGGLDPSATDYTNWGDKVFGTGKTQSYQFSVSGGDNKSKYFISGGYLSDEGIVKPARFDRYTLRVNLDNEVRSWLKIGTSINVMNLNTKDTPDNASSGRGGVIMSTLNTPPFLHTYKGETEPGFILTDKTWYDPNPFQNSWENPIAYMEGPSQQSIDKQLFGNIYGEARLLQGLNLKTRAGVEMNIHQWDYYLDPYRTTFGRKENGGKNGFGQSDKFNSNTWLWENTLDYSKTIEKHKFNAMFGNSIQKYKSYDSYIQGNDFPSDVTVTTLNAANIVSASTDYQDWALSSFFGRVSYDFNSKYYVTGSIRRDGSSKLAHHWGTMPSFSAGWRISSENFMKDIDFITDLKIRGGWGKNGNQEGIPNYTQYGLKNYYRRTPTNPLSGPIEIIATFGNPDLKWETTNQANIGIDLTMLDSRLTVIVDAYVKKTSDVIREVAWPSTLNLPLMQTNDGEIENKGIEFSLGGVILDGNLKWSADYNMSFNRNEITSLKLVEIASYGKIYSNGEEVILFKTGLPLGTFYGYLTDGVDPATGNMKYKDVNDNKIFDPGDRTIIGHAQPKFTYGFTNNLTYGPFDLNVFFQGSQGNDIFNATRVDLEGMFDSKNQSTVVLNRWTPENTITDIPRAIGGGKTDNVRNSDRFVEDGSYIRLKTLTLSYRILDDNAKIKAISKLSVYVTGQNLLTFTKYSGFDPEVNAFGNSAVELGIDYGTYPQTQSVIVGLNVEF
ncbi:MAG: SusC/RagA family TonB-linked outer membrane protein [Bacteroidales bacterium]